MNIQSVKLNKAVKIGLVMGIIFISLAGVYYIAVFLPQKQKMSVDLVKSEMEAKIEKEKTEREKIEQAMQQLEIEKQQKLEEEKATQQLEEEKQKQLTEEANRNAGIKTQQQALVSSVLQKCLDAAEADYKKRLKGIAEAGADSGDTAIGVLILQKQRDKALEKCRK